VLRRRDAAFVVATAVVCAVAVGLSAATGAWDPVFVGG
jgi:hypothetical protein